MIHPPVDFPRPRQRLAPSLSMCALVRDVLLIYAGVLLSQADGGKQISRPGKADATAEECHTYVFRFSNARFLHDDMRRDS
jgi:hypothetical protein